MSYTIKRKKEVSEIKHVLLSADSEPSVYLVPDIVAFNLRDYCMEFLSCLYRHEDDRAYEIIDNTHCPSDNDNSVSYDETGFIYWLNHEKFPNEPAIWVETLDWDVFENKLPRVYQDCPYFNF